MRRDGPATLMLLIALAVAGCTDPDFYDDAPPPNSGGLKLDEVPALSSAEVRIYLSDSTLVHRDSDRTWTVYVDPTGELRGLSESRGATPATVRARGRWEIMEDGRICRKWDGTWDTLDIGCAWVRQNGENYLFQPEGSADIAKLVRRREPGNKRGL